MESFKSELVSIFGEEFVWFTNCDYFYDAIGEDFNDIVHLFRSWEYNEEDIVFFENFCYLDHESDLSKKIVSFNENFSCLPKMHVKLIKKITTHLMKILAEKIERAKEDTFTVIFTSYLNEANAVNHWTDGALYGATCPWNFESRTLGQTYPVWIYLRKIYDENKNRPQDTPSQNLTLKQFILLDDYKIIKLLVQHAFQNDSRALNIDCVCKKLELDLGDMILKMKEVITNEIKKNLFKVSHLIFGKLFVGSLV